MQRFIVFLILIFTTANQALSLTRMDRRFKIYQFPAAMIPRIDGDPSDWDIVPQDYKITIDEVMDLRFGTPVNKKDLDVTVTVGWVKGESRLYFLYEGYDDFWSFSSNDLMSDIFEVIVDADLSGGPLQKELNPESDYGKKGDKTVLGDEFLHYRVHGVHAQNYHIFTPPGNKDWCFVWGVARWAKRLPYSNYACSYTFKQGDNGKLICELYITPFDYASPDGPEHSVISTLNEGEFIGLNWGFNDYDYTPPAQNKLMDAQFNLSHNERWYGIGSDLCAFRLMPLEDRFLPKIKAFADFTIVDMKKGVVAFKDLSIGTVTSWTWDFGDGSVSHEQNPVHRFVKKEGGSGITPVLLTVEGPGGTSVFPIVYEELFLPANTPGK